jgi:chromate transporter
MALTLFDLALSFALVSLVSFGGMPAVMPELQRLTVEVKEWTTPAEFVQLFAVAQAAPGPNVLIASLIGWQAAGLAGAVVALVAFCTPAAIIAWWVAGLWERFKDSPWRLAIQRALAPLVVGLILAGGYVLAASADGGWRVWLIAGAATAASLATRVNPLWIVAGGAVGGAILLS